MAPITKPTPEVEAPKAIQALTAPGLPPLAIPTVDAEAYFESAAQDSPGLVAGAEPGYQYTYFRETDFRDKAAAQNHRNKLIQEGYRPRTGPYATEAASEFAPNAADAEIWRREARIENAEFLARMIASAKDAQWASAWYRRTEQGRNLSKELPLACAEAILAYHAPVFGSSAKREMSAQDLEKVFRAVFQPHPGSKREPSALDILKHIRS